MKVLLTYPQSPHTANRLLGLMDYPIKKVCSDFGLDIKATQFVIRRYLKGMWLTKEQQKSAVVLGILPTQSRD